MCHLFYRNHQVTSENPSLKVFFSGINCKCPNGLVDSIGAAQPLGFHFLRCFFFLFCDATMPQPDAEKGCNCKCIKDAALETFLSLASEPISSSWSAARRWNWVTPYFFNGLEQVAKCICLYLELCIFLLFV